MTLKELQKCFDNNNAIKFKLYSMNYIIEQNKNMIEAYAEDFPGRKEYYKSFKEAINNFKVYNESLISQLDKVIIISIDDE